MKVSLNQSQELNSIIEEYIESPDLNKHKKYARVICFVLTYIPGDRKYINFLGVNKLKKNGNPGKNVGSNFVKIIESHKKQSKNDKKFYIRKEVMDCFHNVKLNYTNNGFQGDLFSILEGFRKLNKPIEITLKKSNLGSIFNSGLIVKTFNALKAGNVNSLGDLFENYDIERRDNLNKFKNIGVGSIGVIDKIMEDYSLDVNLTIQEYKFLKKISQHGV